MKPTKYGRCRIYGLALDKTGRCAFNHKYPEHRWSRYCPLLRGSKRKGAK